MTSPKGGDENKREAKRKEAQKERMFLIISQGGKKIGKPSNWPEMPPRFNTSVHTLGALGYY